jgi:hypothetical protein
MAPFGAPLPLLRSARALSATREAGVFGRKRNYGRTRAGEKKIGKAEYCKFPNGWNSVRRRGRLTRGARHFSREVRG